MYYSPSDATNEIKKRLRNFGEVVFIPHANDQMDARVIDDLEATMALRSGAVRTPGELRNGEYRYIVESDLNGVAVVVEIPDASPNLIVITVIKLNKRKRRR